MYKKLVQSRCDNELYEVLKAQFNTYRNILKKAISKAKRMYYVNVFTQFKNNSKQTWKVIKETLHKNKFSKIYQRFCHLGKIIDNPQKNMILYVCSSHCYCHPIIYSLSLFIIIFG